METIYVATSRQEALNDALSRLHDIGFSWGPNYAEHGSMVAEAISMLGRDDAVAGWVESNKARRGHIPPPPRRAPIDDADEANWRGAIGDPSRLSDWHDYFLRHVAEGPWQEAVRDWLPRLIDGHAGALTHGLIRTGHAVRGLPVRGNPTALQFDELARALAYWAGTYRLPPIDPGSSAPLPHPREAAGWSDALSAHTAYFAGILLGHLDGKLTPAIQLVHTITSAAALRSLLPLLPADFGQHACRCAWTVSGSIVVQVLGVHAVAPVAQALQGQMQWAELSSRAVAHGDEHVIKLTEACLQEDFIRPNPVYRTLVEAFQNRIPA